MSTSPLRPRTLAVTRDPAARSAASPVGPDGIGPDGIRPDTFAELSAAVAGEALAAYRDSWPELADTTYVADPDPEQCGRIVCHPLPDIRTAAETPLRPGHLHRAHAPAPGTPLALVTDVIAAGIARDVLDCIATTARHRADQLAAALESNRTIGTAQGILMARLGVTADRALAQLKAASQVHNRKLRDIAADVVLTGAVPEPPRRRRSPTSLTSPTSSTSSR